MRKPFVIYFQQNSALGACEEYFYLLMEGIDKLTFEKIFVCPNNPILDTLANRVECLGIKVYRYTFEDGNLRLILYLNSLFRKLHPDIIHFNDPCTIGILAARLAGISLLMMTHHTPELNRQYNFKGRILEGIALRNCRLRFIFTSEYSRDTGIRKDKLDKDRSFVIYYGLPASRFNAVYNKKEIYDEFAIDYGAHLIASIGRLSPQKGQNYLIEAASIVIEQIKNVRFFIVGEGELELKLKAQVKEKGLKDYFIFTGYRTDIPRLLSAFEILVMPSLFEGLSFSVIEASAMGVPVIATCVGGLRRSVIDKKTGILVEPMDPQALANAIIWMLKNPREAKDMGLAGKRYFKEMFTQERMVKQTEELYKNMLNTK
jgi:glycosyltransferase involved in cell wall biosynthesis